MMIGAEKKNKAEKEDKQCCEAVTGFALGGQGRYYSKDDMKQIRE